MKPPKVLPLSGAAALMGALAWAGLQWLPVKAPAPGPAPSAAGAQVEKVGRLGENLYLTPTNQLLTPAGVQAELPGTRPQALALSPDGKLLITAGKTSELLVLEPGSGKLLQRLRLPLPLVVAAPAATPAPGSPSSPSSPTAPVPPKEPPPELSLTGLAFSPDGARIYFSNVNGSIQVLAVDGKGTVAFADNWLVPEARVPGRKTEVPAGLAVSADGKKLYVTGNLGNKMHEMDTATGAVLRSWPTGAAPYDVVLAAGKAYVSNMGGRAPGPDDEAAQAGRGTLVRVDGERQIASEGSVSVIDLANGEVKKEVLVELHASAMAASPNGRYVVVANTGSDTLSVLDTRTDEVVEKIWTRQTPADLFGAQPNALVFEPGGKRLFVANGTQNAVAVIDFDPSDRESAVEGLIPVGWFPGALAYDAARKTLCVANIKGQGALRVFKPGEKVKRGTRDFFGTVSLVPVPSEAELERMTKLALANMRHPKLAEAREPARPGQPARPVPERVGEPSVFKHVLYVIKENRTYDQVLGDIKEGNGDPELTVFGEKFTPNQHKIAREFVLLDNTYCSGVQSADGHQWTDSGIANSYMERQVTSSFPRSYPGGKGDPDALAWASSGFIWDNALAHGKTFRNYGEWMLSDLGWKDKGRKDKPKWTDVWADFNASTGLVQLASHPAIESLRAHSKLDSVGWDLNVPDVVRAAEFIKELKAYEQKGTLPELMILFLPNDHTGGTRGQSPTPGAQIADNDLAFGQVVEALSKSKFWPETCIFAIEDDPQAGWDHVSGYRTTCYVASAYSRRRGTVSTQYNQNSVRRTIELILGLPPMNQLDAVATPMGDCFTDMADLTPFTAVPASTPLDQLNPVPAKVADAVLRADAIASEKLPLDEADRCPEEELNEILWRAMKGSGVEYPAWAVRADGDEE